MMTERRPQTAGMGRDDSLAPARRRPGGILAWPFRTGNGVRRPGCLFPGGPDPARVVAGSR